MLNEAFNLNINSTKSKSSSINDISTYLEDLSGRFNPAPSILNEPSIA